MKNNGVKNLKVVAAGLCLGAVLLTGCGEKENEVKFGSATINYETEIPQGSISYEDIKNYVVIGEFEQNSKFIYKLLIKSVVDDSLRDTERYEVYYRDLKTGVSMVNFTIYPKNDYVEWGYGKELNLYSDQITIAPYLIQEDYIQREYDIEELITFFEEKVLPALETNSQEFVK